MIKFGDTIYMLTRFTQSHCLRKMNGTRGITYDSIYFPDPTEEESAEIKKWRGTKSPRRPRKSKREISTQKHIGDEKNERIDLFTFKPVYDSFGRRYTIPAMERQEIGFLPSLESWEKEMLGKEIEPYHHLVEGDYYRWFMIEERPVTFESYAFNCWIYKLNTETRRVELAAKRILTPQ